MRSALLVLLVASAATAQTRQPAAVLKDNHLFVALPESVLKDRRVHSRLESALTTTFILKAGSTAARIEIRYDLWDEIYHVQRMEPGRKEARKQTLATTAKLDEWWRTPIDLGAFSGRSIDLELLVLPFSAAEEIDARQWLSKSGGAGGPSPDAKSVVDMLIGTTLSARPIVSYRWRLEIARP